MRLIIVFILALFLWFFSFLSLAPFVPTRNKDLERIAKIANLKPNENFLEVGCGTAKVSLFLAQKYPQNQIIAIEFSPFFYLYSKLKAYFSHQKNFTILYGNALHLNFKNYDVLYLFGTPNSLKEKILPKFITESKATSRLLSYCFCFDKTELKEIKHKESPEMLSIYEYRR